MTHKKTLEELLFDLEHGDADARFEVVGQLGRLKERKALSAVIGALNDENTDVRNVAIVALQFEFFPQENISKYERKELLSVLKLFKGSPKSRGMALYFFQRWKFLRNETTNLQKQKLRLPKNKPQKERLTRMVHKV